MNTSRSLAARLVQTWVSIYTRGLPEPVRAERMSEIASDLWEQTHGQPSARARASGTALQVLLRFVLGLPFDLAWRIETGAAVRSGKEPKMTTERWTTRRWISLLIAFVFLPLPTAWISAASTRLIPSREESTPSILMLAVGSNLCALPIGLGVLTIFWDAPAFPVSTFGEGLAEIIAGSVSMAGLYVARANLGLGLLLVVGGASAIAALASWALPAVLLGGVALVVMAVVRSLVSPPARPVIA